MAKMNSKGLLRALILCVLMLLTNTGFLPFEFYSSREPQNANQANSVPVLTCEGLGNGGDRVDTNGIRFTVGQNFSAVEVRLALPSPQTINITAELRKSTGFIGSPSYSTKIKLLINQSIVATPYQPVRFDFGHLIAVTSSQTFTLKLSSPDTSALYFEVIQPGIPCLNAQVTYDNTSSNPVAIGSPAGFKVLAPDPALFSLNSSYQPAPPSIDGKLDYSEWNLANQIYFDNGFISATNDATRLYLLIDVLGEPVDNPDDILKLSFDIDNNHQVTANVDKIYQINPSNNLRYSFYTGPWPSISGEQPVTLSSRAKGFGCDPDDGTLSLVSSAPVKTSCSPHRIWELAIDLSELNAAPGGSVQAGMMIGAVSPAFSNFIPANALSDFGKLITIHLAPAPASASGAFPGNQIQLDPKPVEVTQAIQNRDNGLPLSAGKKTVARVYTHTTGTFTIEPVTVFLYGSRGSADLSGSPLLIHYNAPSQNNRSSLSGTANFVLPDSWTQGSTTLSTSILDIAGHKISSGVIPITYSAKSIPNYWIVPVNTGSSSLPVLPNPTTMIDQENYLSAVFPTNQVNFINQPWTVIGPQSASSVMGGLSDFYNAVQAAYQTSLLAAGAPSFVFPDQIYGMTPTGGGQANPVWLGGTGVIASGYWGTSAEATMAHEIDHNLDRSSLGTWGRNVPQGCSTASPDTFWPYPDATIQETGFDSRPFFNLFGGAQPAIPSSVPDFMSHCQSGRPPAQWISPYRWVNLFNSIPAPSAFQASVVYSSDYYFSGQISRDVNGVISGTLNPVIKPAGPASNNPGSGDYTIQFNASGPISIVNFPIHFSDDAEEYSASVNFTFQVPVSTGPDPATITQVALKHLNPLTHTWDTLDQISVDPLNLIGMNFTAPAPGASWSGLQKVTWNSNNINGLVLSYTLLYSNDGLRWFPVASGISATSWLVDTSALPGGPNQTARFRLLATDGFNTAQVDSDLFTLGANPPQLKINAPQANQYLPLGTPVLLSGEAYDVQDGFLPENAIIWTDGSTLLGTGRNLRASLSPGMHTLTLIASNILGKTSSIVLQITIAQTNYFPILFK